VHSVTIKLTFYQLIQTIYNEFSARGEGRGLPLATPPRSASDCKAQTVDIVEKREA